MEKEGVVRKPDNIDPKDIIVKYLKAREFINPKSVDDLLQTLIRDRYLFSLTVFSLKWSGSRVPTICKALTPLNRDESLRLLREMYRDDIDTFIDLGQVNVILEMKILEEHPNLLRSGKVRSKIMEGIRVITREKKQTSRLDS